MLIYIVVNLRTKRPSSGTDQVLSSGRQLLKKYRRFVAAIGIVCHYLHVLCLKVNENIGIYENINRLRQRVSTGVVSYVEIVGCIYVNLHRNERGLGATSVQPKFW